MHFITFNRSVYILRDHFALCETYTMKTLIQTNLLPILESV